MVSALFFSIDSVQDDLKQVGPDQRQATINNVRRELGLPGSIWKKWKSGTPNATSGGMSA